MFRKEQLLPDTVDVATAKKMFDKWQTEKCCITQASIILPVEVISKAEGSPNATILSYEYAAIRTFIDDAIERKIEPCDPQTRLSIVRASSEDEIVASYKTRKKITAILKQHDLINIASYEAFDDKLDIGILHFFIDARCTIDLLTKMTQLKSINKLNLFNELHYTSGKPALHELIRHSSVLAPPSRQDAASFLPELVKMLSESFPEINEWRVCAGGLTPLMEAAKMGHLEAFHLFFEKEKAMLGATDRESNNLLHHIVAAPTLHMESMLRKAVESGLNVLQANKKTVTPLGILVDRICATSTAAKPDLRIHTILVNCLKYLAEKQPQCFSEHKELSLAGIDGGLSIFKKCIGAKQLEAALIIASTGSAHLIESFGENNSALHVLAKSLNGTFSALYCMQVHRTCEAFLKLGLLNNENSAGQTFIDILPTLSYAPALAFSWTAKQFIQEQRWLFFTNLYRTKMQMDDTHRPLLLQAILSHPSTAYQYRVALAVILKSQDNFKLKLKSEEYGELPVDRFAIIKDNDVAIRIMLDTGMLATTKEKLYHFATLIGANSNVLALLRPEGDTIKAVVKTRRHSFSLLPAPRLQPQSKSVPPSASTSTSISISHT